MARCDDRDRVPAVGGPDGADGQGPPDLPRDRAVASGLAVGDREQRLPDALLELRALEIERHGERLQPAGEVGGELPLRLDQDRMARVLDQGARAVPG